MPQVWRHFGTRGAAARRAGARLVVDRDPQGGAEVGNRGETVLGVRATGAKEHVVGGRRCPVAEDVLRSDGEPVLVDFVAHAALEDLGGDVAAGAGEVRRPVVARPAPALRRDREVGEQEAGPVPAEQQVGGLDVAVDHPPPVQSIQRRGRFLQQRTPARRGQRQALAGGHRAEVVGHGFPEPVHLDYQPVADSAGAMGGDDAVDLADRARHLRLGQSTAPVEGVEGAQVVGLDHALAGRHHPRPGRVRRLAEDLRDPAEVGERPLRRQLPERGVPRRPVRHRGAAAPGPGEPVSHGCPPPLPAPASGRRSWPCWR